MQIITKAIDAAAPAVGKFVIHSALQVAIPVAMIFTMSKVDQARYRYVTWRDSKPFLTKQQIASLKAAHAPA